MDSTKLKNEMGWSEQTSFEVGLKSTVDWYLTNKIERKSEELILIYGAGGWIGGQFSHLLDDQGIKYVAGKSRIGDDPDQVIEKEVLDVAPTHVVSFIGRTHGPGNNTIDYLEGSPDKL